MSGRTFTAQGSPETSQLQTAWDPDGTPEQKQTEDLKEHPQGSRVYPEEEMEILREPEAVGDSEATTTSDTTGLVYYELMETGSTQDLHRLKPNSQQ